MPQAELLLVNTPTTLALAIIALWLGYRINQSVGVLHRYNIPPAVSGGLPISAVVAASEALSGWEIRFDLHLRDLLAQGDRPVTELVSELVAFPETAGVLSVLHEMQTRRVQLVLVVDEHGAAAGIVTVEDLLEEIVGEITDEYDRDQAEVEPLVAEDGQELVRVPANMLVDDLAEMFEVEIETEDVDSVGGLLATAIGMVPIQGSVGRVADLELTAERMAGRRRRVSTVLVRRLREPEPSEEETVVQDHEEAVPAPTENEVSNHAPQ